MQAEKYWKKRQDELAALPRGPEPVAPADRSHSEKSIRMLKKFDKHRKNLVKQGEGGWMAEVNQYLGEVLNDAEAKMDVVKYWQVSILTFIIYDICNDTCAYYRTITIAF